MQTPASSPELNIKNHRQMIKKKAGIKLSWRKVRTCLIKGKLRIMTALVLTEQKNCYDEKAQTGGLKEKRLSRKM